MGGDTPNCEHCGDNDNDNPNPLDSCGRENLGCNNPCGHGPHNSAKCESVPSQIANFTQQFFGDVVKTEVNGVVSWSLPCSLDIGLPANPRGVNEGLACYFLRLFMDGITGLKGDKGDPGNPGTDGAPAYTVTTQSFNQPTLASPNIQVSTFFNPAVSVAGIFIFIATSGWYQVNGSDNNGTLFLTLIQPISGTSGMVTPGKLVVIAGTPGASIVGPQGKPGPKGDQGPPGPEPTATNGEYFAGIGVDFLLPLTYTAVNFTNSSPQFLAPVPGNYLITVTAIVEGQPGILSTDTVHLKLVNTSISSDVPGSTMFISNLVNGEFKQITISVVATTDAANQTIALFGECSTASKISVVALNTTISWVRLQ